MSMSIETYLIRYLSGVLPYPVAGDDPGGAGPFVTLEKTGSRERDCLVASTVAVQSWAPTRAMAMALNETVKAAMDGAVILDAISRSHCETDYHHPDIATRRSRYQAIYEVVHTKIIEEDEEHE